jgi:hypothetical protein
VLSWFIIVIIIIIIMRFFQEQVSLNARSKGPMVFLTAVILEDSGKEMAR